MRTEDAIAVIRTLAERWPKTFFPDVKRRKPLKIGIFHGLKIAAPDIDRKVLRLALRVYTTSGAYLFACTKGHKRVDLNGNAVEEVCEMDQARAREILEARRYKEKALAEARKPKRSRGETRWPIPSGVNSKKPVLNLKEFVS